MSMNRRRLTRQELRAQFDETSDALELGVDEWDDWRDPMWLPYNDPECWEYRWDNPQWYEYDHPEWVAPLFEQGPEHKRWWLPWTECG